MIIPQGNEIWYCAKFKFAETTKTKKKHPVFAEN